MENPSLIHCTGDWESGPAPTSDITLRDIFAGMAMQGMLSRTGEDGYDESKSESMTLMITRSYLIADDMLKGREAQKCSS